MRAMTVVSSSNVQPDSEIIRNAMNELKNESSGANADGLILIDLKGELSSVSSESDKDSIIIRGQLNSIQSVSTTLIGQYGLTYYGHCKYN